MNPAWGKRHQGSHRFTSLWLDVEVHLNVSRAGVKWEAVRDCTSTISRTLPRRLEEIHSLFPVSGPLTFTLQIHTGSPSRQSFHFFCVNSHSWAFHFDNVLQAQAHFRDVNDWLVDQPKTYQHIIWWSMNIFSCYQLLKCEICWFCVSHNRDTCSVICPIRPVLTVMSSVRWYSIHNATPWQWPILRNSRITGQSECKPSLTILI